MQPYEEIEKHYEKPDPWGYQTNPEDLKRKEKILQTARHFAPFRVFHDRAYEKALDIGSGEGWITKDLPADIKHAYEISMHAKNRLPYGVIGVSHPDPSYDLVIATGVLYSHYDWKLFFRLMNTHSSRIILTCNIKDWERPEMNDPLFHESCLGVHQIHTEEFSYREFTQKLRVLKKL